MDIPNEIRRRIPAQTRSRLPRFLEEDPRLPSEDEAESLERIFRDRWHHDEGSALEKPGQS